MIALSKKTASYAAYVALAISATWLVWTGADFLYLAGWYGAQGSTFHPPYLALALSLAVLGGGLILAARGMNVLAAIAAALVMALVTALWFGSVA
jgi:hypothetical protein